MSNFEELVIKMRAAQIAYNLNPTAENLNACEDLEIDCDDYLDFLQNCTASSWQGVKKYLRERQP